MAENLAASHEIAVPLQRFNTAIDCFTLKIIYTTMKKLVFMFAAFAAISFASCGSKTEPPAQVQDTIDTRAADSVDTLAADSVDTLAA